ncbi:hypothetical protein L873DRAFT_1476341 [Choiromyces venosus 120613-1]|uniref:Uncharacterized protein n=1 Tax=Choiromyces venosus 120613-1 TaxID=1336337 RepID=A0A3N4JBW6_9PEZI|nr:hypothetical protein L873DRAFT_1476341 [Choiromyces venosus 120613-1]
MISTALPFPARFEHSVILSRRVTISHQRSPTLKASLPFSSPCRYSIPSIACQPHKRPCSLPLLQPHPSTAPQRQRSATETQKEGIVGMNGKRGGRSPFSLFCHC